MEINGNNISTYQPMTPSKPAEPISPPGGNIENRQPPSEPSAPVKPADVSSDVEVNYTNRNNSVLLETGSLINTSA